MSKRTLFKTIKAILAVAVLAAVIYFISTSLKENISELQGIVFTPNYWYLAACVVLLLVFQGFIMVPWRRQVLSGSTSTLNYVEAYGIFYMPSVLKYLPGRVWSYAMQMYMLERRGFSIPKILFDNLLIILFTISTPALLGVVYVLTNIVALSIVLRVVLIVLCVVIYIAMLVLMPKLIPGVIGFINKRAKKKIDYRQITIRRVFTMQGWFILAYFAFIAAGATACAGVGFDGGVIQCMEMGVICTISMIVGFVVLIMPGGMGVQEFLMYIMTSSRHSVALAIVLPVVFRILQIIVSVISSLGGLVIVYPDVKRFFSDRRQAKRDCEEESEC